jgi:hypothetical protein
VRLLRLHYRNRAGPAIGLERLSGFLAFRGGGVIGRCPRRRSRAAVDGGSGPRNRPPSGE